MAPCRRLRRLASHVVECGGHPQLVRAAAERQRQAEDEQAGLPIFRHVNVDVEAWERDGYMAFPGILTPEACDRALASLKALQAKNDAIYMQTDWNGMDWGRFGLPPLAKPVTPEQQRSLCGGCELSMTPPGSVFPPGWGAKARARGVGKRFVECPGLPLAPTSGFRTHGFIPAGFPLAYDDFVLDMACHPQVCARARARVWVWARGCVAIFALSLISSYKTQKASW